VRFCSGVTPPSIPSPPAPSSRSNKSTTSATTATATPPSSTVPPTRPPANSHTSPGWKRPPRTPKRGKRRMITGPSPTRCRRMASDVGVAAIRISSRSRPKRVVVSRNGSRSLVVTLPLRARRSEISPLTYSRVAGRGEEMIAIVDLLSWLSLSSVL
jgi:hypothetical protein